jgi:U3 small nucleolar RNA-associated protein 21
VLLGAADGRLALVNFVTCRVVHVFAGFGAAVRCVSASPALDVVAVGTANGRVVLHNIRYDTTLAVFTHDVAHGPVTCLAFRTGAGTPLLAAAGVDGAISVWDLTAKRIHSLLKEAHDGPVRMAAPARMTPGSVLPVAHTLGVAGSVGNADTKH